MCAPSVRQGPFPIRAFTFCSASQGQYDYRFALKMGAAIASPLCPYALQFPHKQKVCPDLPVDKGGSYECNMRPAHIILSLHTSLQVCTHHPKSAHNVRDADSVPVVRCGYVIVDICVHGDSILNDGACSIEDYDVRTMMQPPMHQACHHHRPLNIASIEQHFTLSIPSLLDG